MEKPQRKNNRLLNYDYSQNGAYFITVCTKDKQHIFGKIVGARIARPNECTVKIKLSETGKIVNDGINNIEAIYKTICVDKYVIMPNHIHMILVVNNGRAMRAPTISTVINQLKGYITKQTGYSIWQKLFHDHIIRNEQDYLNIWEYIDTNPHKWQLDKYYSQEN